MTDTPNYTKRNPKVLLGQQAIAQVKANPEVLVAPQLNIYNEDGTPTTYVPPTFQQTSDLLDVIIAHVAGQDMRAVLRMMEEVDAAMSNALMSALSSAHMIAHAPEYNEGYDEQTMCEGVKAYLDPDRHFNEEATVGDLLQPFFTKPDTKLH